MKKKNIKKQRSKTIIVILIIIVIIAVVFFQTRSNLNVVSVVEEIDDYNYYLESNATRIYKKYYKELKEELKDNKIDEENYASLISKLFIIDFYTLNNKVTNKDIGGVQFIHSDLKEKFTQEAINSIYKYVKSNVYNNRKQRLPEVNNVKVISIENIKYNYHGYSDDNAYKVDCEIGYVKDYNYPTKITLGIIHENNKLVIVEIE